MKGKETETEPRGWCVSAEMLRLVYPDLMRLTGKRRERVIAVALYSFITDDNPLHPSPFIDDGRKVVRVR